VQRSPLVSGGDRGEARRIDRASRVRDRANPRATTRDLATAGRIRESAFCDDRFQLPLPPGSRYEQQPPQHRVRELYASCDVWLCGSRSEGFHLPPLEALACRTPVVSTSVGGPIDVVEGGTNGWLVPIGDVAALADRLADVLRAPEERWRALSSAAHATAQRSSLERATHRLEQVLAEAAAEARS
jgi:glycosyltransferase involved in cell wall biosynthesis